MKARKENKVYTINTEQEKQRYLKEGFDIYDDEGNLLEYTPLKKIEFSKYAALKKENEKLKERITELEEKLTPGETEGPEHPAGGKPTRKAKA